LCRNLSLIACFLRCLNLILKGTAMIYKIYEFTKTLIALTVTPLLLFVSPAISLYLVNQKDFGQNSQVILPYIFVGLIALGIGLVLHRLAETRNLRVILFAYYLVGPVFLVYSGLRNVPFTVMDSPITSFIFIVLTLVTAFVLEKKVRLSGAASLFALMGIALLGGDIYQYVKKKEPDLSPPPRITSTKLSDASKSKVKLPNIYHIILDEFQTEKFVPTLTDDIRQRLGGFIFFPNNIATYGRTGMSLASIYSGKKYDPTTPQLEFMKNAFSSDKSILYSLKQAGYTTYGYLEQFYPFEMELIDHKVYNSAEKQNVVPDYSLFNKLWLYSNLPSFIVKGVMDKDEISQLKKRNLLAGTFNIASYISFKKYLEEERILPDHNRYTYVHILLPHFPNIFHADGTYNLSMKKTSELEQARCATKCIADFVDTLKKLGRYDNSLIILGGDHGAFYNPDKKNIPDPNLRTHDPKEYERAKDREFAWNRSRALLLLKPAGNNAGKPFMISEAGTTLLDITPTIAECAGVDTKINFDGVSLLKRRHSSEGIKREFYFFDKKGVYEWTDKLARYLINGNEIEGPEYIILKNNQKF